MNYFNALAPIPPLALFIVYLWSLLWKGFALWKASKYDQKNWFIVILVINSIGILEVIYLFAFAKKKMKLGELIFWKSK